MIEQHGQQAYEAAVVANKCAWRNAEKSRRLLRPREAPRVEQYLLRKMNETFGLSRTEPPLIAWSIFHEPKNLANEYGREYAIPEQLNPDDRKAYVMGMHALTEYATNYATKVFFHKNSRGKISEKIIDTYAEALNEVSYGLVLRDTFRTMKQVEKYAQANGKDYSQTLIQALMHHNFDPLNTLITQTGLSEGTDITNLAVTLGKRQRAFLQQSLNNAAEESDKDSYPKKLLKNIFLSLGAPGIMRSPGIVEVSIAQPALLGPLPFPVGIEAFIRHHNFVQLAIDMGLSAASLGILSSASVFVAVHEAIHDFSSTDTYIGMIPAKLQKKNTHAV